MFVICISEAADPSTNGASSKDPEADQLPTPAAGSILGRPICRTVSYALTLTHESFLPRI